MSAFEVDNNIFITDIFSLLSEGKLLEAENCLKKYLKSQPVDMKYKLLFSYGKREYEGVKSYLTNNKINNLIKITKFYLIPPSDSFEIKNLDEVLKINNIIYVWNKHAKYIKIYKMC